jgi:hypothetical protein
MNPADKRIADILSEFEEDFQSNTWIVPGGKSRAILHHCTERMAARAKVTFSEPQIISAALDNVVIIVSGRMGDRVEWSFGEASPKNNRNAYPFSMAEKRAKGRVALKLIGLHGLLHDETESEDFKPSDARPNGAEAAGDDALAGIERSANPNQARKTADWDKVVADLNCHNRNSGQLLLWAKSRSGRLAGHPWRKETVEKWREHLGDTLAIECHSVRELIRWREESHEHTSVLPTDWQLAASAVWEAAKAKTAAQLQREDA